MYSSIILSCYHSDGGSDSEGEDVGGVGDVTLPQDFPGRGNTQAQQSMVRLSEVLTYYDVIINVIYILSFILAWS